MKDYHISTATYRYLLLLSTTVACLVGCQSPTASSSDVDSNQYPNIIFILADDMGYGDIQSINSDAKVSTPHLDRLVAEGMYFTDAHSGSAVCTPTRYGVLTGRYCFRTRLKSGVLSGHSPSLIEPGRMTVASLLSNAGYHSACIGKWHLGLDWKKKNPDLPLYIGADWANRNTENIDYAAIVDGGPTDHGFDFSYIIPSSLDIPPYCYISNKYVVEPELEMIDGIREGRGLFWRSGDASKGFDFMETLPHLTDQSVSYIKTQATESPQKPFFLYFPLTAPHTPWIPTPEFQGTSDAGTYGDFVQQVDHTIGQLLHTLDSLGITDETLIIFSSDNGSHWKPEDIAEFDHYANDDLRGMKSDAWEGGHRVPFIARWPNQITGGAVSNQLVCLTDLLATVGEITHQELPYNAGEDSYSFLSAFNGEEGTSSMRESVIHHSINGTFAMRKGKWKLIQAQGSGGWSYAGKEEDPPGQLYDISSDRSETQNLYNEYPEIVEELTETLDMYKLEERSRY